METTPSHLPPPKIEALPCLSIGSYPICSLWPSCLLPTRCVSYEHRCAPVPIWTPLGTPHLLSTRLQVISIQVSTLQLASQPYQSPCLWLLRFWCAFPSPFLCQKPAYPSQLSCIHEVLSNSPTKSNLANPGFQHLLFITFLVITYWTVSSLDEPNSPPKQAPSPAKGKIVSCFSASSLSMPCACYTQCLWNDLRIISLLLSRSKLPLSKEENQWLYCKQKTCMTISKITSVLDTALITAS